MLPGGHEQNEWVRDAQKHPIFRHLLELKLVWYTMDALLLLIAYKQVQKFSQTLADWLVVGVCLWAASSYVEVAIGNFIVYLGWVSS
jgi:hypothetical protein